MKTMKRFKKQALKPKNKRKCLKTNIKKQKTTKFLKN